MLEQPSDGICLWHVAADSSPSPKLMTPSSAMPIHERSDAGTWGRTNDSEPSAAFHCFRRLGRCRCSTEVHGPFQVEWTLLIRPAEVPSYGSARCQASRKSLP